MPAKFSETEILISKLICKQLTNEEIAEVMGYSKRYIETVRLAMSKKMKVKNSVGIAIYSIKRGWVKI